MTEVVTQIVRIDVHSTHQQQFSTPTQKDVGFSKSQVYFLQGPLSRAEVERICQTMLTDPVAERFQIDEFDQSSKVTHTIDVTMRPGVTDTAAESLLRAANKLGIAALEAAATGQRYHIFGALDADELHELASKVFSNPVIQQYAIDKPISAPFVQFRARDETVETIGLTSASDEALQQISQERRLSLNLEEMQAIREYFRAENREPTDAELEMLAQTWSEHCVHKTFKAKISYSGPARGAAADSPPESQHIDGILTTYIRAATEKINKPWVRSAFVDNAGIIKFDERWDIAFKAETHNRPSAIEPFGGANTGVGGVIRDVIGVSARPIANTDMLCFGPPDLSDEELPEGVLHPKRVAEGVVAGIEDYGNKMGIPTVNGSITYHKGYTSNPLVFCGCVGILPHGAHRTEPQPGDYIVVIGGRTGRDGLRGATFSSMEMDTTTSEVSGGAVQIGHPIHEKQTLEVILRARDEGLYTAITDCGAGGLSSAVGEMGEHIGATVQLESVPLKYPGLRPWEIWLSEAQERMVLAVTPAKWERLRAIADGQAIDATVIGTFEPTGRLTLYYGEKVVGDIAMNFLHDGLPQRHMQAVWEPPTLNNTDSVPVDENYADSLLSLLSMPTIRSKEDVIRRYDHEVQGGTAVKPLVGVQNSGPSDATVIVPLETVQGNGFQQAIAISNGVCPLYGEIDPYAMAWAAVDEAIRNLVAVGADPDQIAILDNFSWGNTSLPDRLGALIRCAQGCYDAAIAYDVPFISGKDSLNNEYLGQDGQRHAIPGTLVISAIGIVPDVNKTVTMDFKSPGSPIYVLGETRNEMGGSHYHNLKGYQSGIVPQPKKDALTLYRAVYQAMQGGMVKSCHDVSEGGIAVALAEMCIAGDSGARIDFCGDIPGYDTLDNADLYNIILFSESSGRLIIEVNAERQQEFEALMSRSLSEYDYAVSYGSVQDRNLVICGCDSPPLIDLSIEQLEYAWRGELDPASDDIPPDAPNGPPMQQKTFTHTLPARQGRAKVLILHANGTNRDRDAYLACELAGGEPEIVHVNQIFAGERNLLDYHLLVVPGGFSYGDDLGAGVLWALDLRERLGDDLNQFIDEGRPVLGICNGFQTLVKAGLLPGSTDSQQRRKVTLTHNERTQFECRWVYLKPNPASPCLFTQGIEELLYVPVAHGEGRVLTADDAAAQALWDDGLVAVSYVNAQGNPAGYPFNPNGSILGIAGLCNPAGNVFGLMPHPENHIFPWQHPRCSRSEQGMSGLQLFKNGVKFA